jgi:hypothetical protein
LITLPRYDIPTNVCTALSGRSSKTDPDESRIVLGRQL